jgi:hypothetical protein
MRKALRVIREVLRRLYRGQDGAGFTLQARPSIQRVDTLHAITHIVRSRHNASNTVLSSHTPATLMPISIESTTIRKCLVTSYRGQPA